jgi:N-acetyl sugar amidotransferase
MSSIWVGREATNNQRLEAMFAKIKEQTADNKYDGILGLSGGIDSSYVALLAHRYGLKPLAVHVDAGWNSDEAVSNIHSLVSNLDLDLVTIVIDWQEMRDLQVAYLKSGLPNQDVPQDHAFFASLYKIAAEKKINRVISGGNFSTESILPVSWGYDAMDGKHLRSVYKRHGSGKLNTYPTMSLPDFWGRNVIMRGLKVETPLNQIHYNKDSAKLELQEQISWSDYGGKHRESRFTEFFQHYFLPERFGYDKRKAHLSSLIVSGEITRETALEELTKPAMSETDVRRSIKFVERKLELSPGSINEFVDLPKSSWQEYSNDNWVHSLVSNKTLAAAARRILKF